jgi:hypothetical protein
MYSLLNRSPHLLRPLCAFLMGGQRTHLWYGQLQQRLCMRCWRVARSNLAIASNARLALTWRVWGAHKWGWVLWAVPLPHLSHAW